MLQSVACGAGAAVCLALCVLPGEATAADAAGPNIIVLLADDLGFADVSCYGGKIPTPNIDRMAAEGMRFTDAHTTSSVCTPTRYGLLTGRYNWRTKLQRGVLGGLSPPLIEPGRMTLASMLKQHGYHTACVGKWHLGMDWVVKPGAEVSELSIEPREQVFNVDFAKPISNGPNSVGFDYYYGISASLDMVPYAFIENDRVESLPTEDRDFLMMHDRTPERRTRKGPTSPEFDAADVLPVLTRKSVEYIERRAEDARRGQPFFLYLSFASPHTPILPTPEWQGKSGINPYADFVMETDWAVGEILKALDQHGLSGQTLIVFTSDNGCSPQARFDELAEHGHQPSGPLRGHKADLFEGGHRVPLVARWPGRFPRRPPATNSFVRLTSWPPLQSFWRFPCRPTLAKTAPVFCQRFARASRARETSLCRTRSTAASPFAAVRGSSCCAPIRVDGVLRDPVPSRPPDSHPSSSSTLVTIWASRPIWPRHTRRRSRS